MTAEHVADINSVICDRWRRHECVLCCCLLSRTADLEAALADSCDFSTVKNIAKSRPVPNHLRAKIWQVVINFYFTFRGHLDNIVSCHLSMKI